jgi:glycosyltransferase involved in cell wall biosynthesis
MKVAFLFDVLASAGGGNAAVESEIDLIKRLNFDSIEKKIIVTSKILKTTFQKEHNIDVIYYNNSFLKKIVNLLYKNKILNFFAKKLKLNNYFESFLKFLNIDLVIFLSPSTLVLDLYKTNFIYTVWEFQHKTYPFFPEYKNNFDINLREKIMNFISLNAYQVFAGTKKSKDDFIQFYNCEKSKIIIKPISSPLVNIDKIHTEKKVSDLVKDRIKNISNDFLFYPAQYWAHKNHFYLLEALEFIKKNKRININKFIFTGSNKGNLNYIKRLVLAKELQEDVIFFDFLSDEDIVYLYKNCYAVVVPTYVGTVSFPLIEAFYFKKPIIANSVILDDLYKTKILNLDISHPDSLEKNLIFIKNNQDHVGTLLKSNYNFYKDYYLSDNQFNKLKDSISSYYYLKQRWE